MAFSDLQSIFMTAMCLSYSTGFAYRCYRSLLYTATELSIWKSYLVYEKKY